VSRYGDDEDGVAKRVENKQRLGASNPAIVDGILPLPR